MVNTNCNSPPIGGVLRHDVFQAFAIMHQFGAEFLQQVVEVLFDSDLPLYCFFIFLFVNNLPMSGFIASYTCNDASLFQFPQTALDCSFGYTNLLTIGSIIKRIIFQNGLIKMSVIGSANWFIGSEDDFIGSEACDFLNDSISRVKLWICSSIINFR